MGSICQLSRPGMDKVGRVLAKEALAGSKPGMHLPAMVALSCHERAPLCALYWLAHGCMCCSHMHLPTQDLWFQSVLSVGQNVPHGAPVRSCPSCLELCVELYTTQALRVSIATHSHRANAEHITQTKR
eukprot:scaffold67025_cov14-Tisochrysis_lutea.AAC.1